MTATIRYMGSKRSLASESAEYMISSMLMPLQLTPSLQLGPLPPR